MIWQGGVGGAEWEERREDRKEKEVEGRESFFSSFFSLLSSLSIRFLSLTFSFSFATPAFSVSLRCSVFSTDGCRRARDKGGRAVCKGRDRREKGLGRQGNLHRDEPRVGLRRRFQGLSFFFFEFFKLLERERPVPFPWGLERKLYDVVEGEWPAEPKQRQALWLMDEEEKTAAAFEEEKQRLLFFFFLLSHTSSVLRSPLSLPTIPFYETVVALVRAPQDRGVLQVAERVQVRRRRYKRKKRKKKARERERHCSSILRRVFSPCSCPRARGVVRGA